jgi:hypothetical protein
VHCRWSAVPLLALDVITGRFLWAVRVMPCWRFGVLILAAWWLGGVVRISGLLRAGMVFSDRAEGSYSVLASC